jgi:hypothetical protein
LPTPHNCDIEAFASLRAGRFQTAFAFARISNLRAATKTQFLRACWIACGEKDSIAGRQTLAACFRCHDHRMS